MKTIKNVHPFTLVLLVVTAAALLVFMLRTPQAAPPTYVVCTYSSAGQQCFSPGQLNIAGMFR